MSTGFRVPYSMIYMVMLLNSIIFGAIAGTVLSMVISNFILLGIVTGLLTIFFTGFIRYQLMKLTLKFSGFETEGAMELNAPIIAKINAVIAGFVGGAAGAGIATDLLGSSSTTLIGLFAGFCAALVMTGLMLPYLSHLQSDVD